MRRGALAVAFACAVVTAAGCGERAEPLGELASPYPVTARGAGEVAAVLQQRPDRIVALDSGSAEVVRALGAGRRLVGGPARAPGVVDVLRRNGQVDTAAALELRPNLVVAPPGAHLVELNRLRDQGAAVYIRPAASVREIERATLELGDLVGSPVRARRLIARIRSGVAAVDERIEEVVPVTVFVDAFQAVQERPLLDELVRRANGENVAPGYRGISPVSPGELLELDPDVYLTTSASGITLASLTRAEETEDLRAVRERRVAVVDAGLLGGAGLQLVTAYRQIATELHPDAFR